MKQKTVFKIILDVVMLVLYILLMFGYDIDSFFHEIIGIFIGVLFIIHIAWNLPLIRGLYKSIKNNQAKSSKKFLFITDIILPVSVFVTILCGILMSNVLFEISIGYETILFIIHKIASYISLGIFALHSILHAKYVVGILRNIGNCRKDTALYKPILKSVMAVAIICCSYALIHMLYQQSDSESTAETYITQSEDNEIAEDVTSENDDTTDDEDTSEEEDTDEDVPTLTEYLSKLRCTGCGKRCVLINPHCEKGEQKAQTATAQYYATYQD